MVQADVVIYGPLLRNFPLGHARERHAREGDGLPCGRYPSEHTMVGPMAGPARNDFVPLYNEVFEGKLEIGEGTAPRGHRASDAVRPVHLVAAVSRRVADMVDIGRRDHLLDSLELLLVPDGGDGTSYHRFVCL